MNLNEVMRPLMDSSCVLGNFSSPPVSSRISPSNRYGCSVSREILAEEKIEVVFNHGIVTRKHMGGEYVVLGKFQQITRPHFATRKKLGIPLLLGYEYRAESWVIT